MGTKNNKILFKNIKKRESMLINECIYEKKSYIELVKKKKRGVTPCIFLGAYDSLQR